MSRGRRKRSRHYGHMPSRGVRPVEGVFLDGLPFVFLEDEADCPICCGGDGEHSGGHSRSAVDPERSPSEAATDGDGSR